VWRRGTGQKQSFSRRASSSKVGLARDDFPGLGAARVSDRIELFLGDAMLTMMFGVCGADGAWPLLVVGEYDQQRFPQR